MVSSHPDPDPVTDQMHDNSWSANLEGPEHGADPGLVVEQAIDAVEHTRSRQHVNLVTYGDHGHPSTYLYEPLRDAIGENVRLRHVDQCGCGGHVTRAHVER